MLNFIENILYHLESYLSRKAGNAFPNSPPA